MPRAWSSQGQTRKCWPTRDDVVARKLRLFQDENIMTFDYPNVQDIKELIANVIPSDVSFYYEISGCEDDNIENDPCDKFDKSKVITRFWRYLSEQDLINANNNLKEFNNLMKIALEELKKANPDNYGDEPWKINSDELRRIRDLMAHLGGGNWPDKFLLISADRGGDSCEENNFPGIGGWSFKTYNRTTLLDVILVENVSKVPLTIDGLLAASISEPRLRLETENQQTGDSLVEMSETLRPGERLLIPVKISFGPADLTKFFAFPLTGKKIYAEIGAHGFKGNTDGYASPSKDTYVFGEEFAVSGLRVGGERIDFKEEPNFLSLTLASGTGSCPYLTSWDEERKEWVEHGKVLHKAPDQAREYTDTIMLSGFRSRFRLVEREAELASIDAAELAVVLKGGTTLFLATDDKALAAKDGTYLRLALGEVAELDFKLPEGIAEDDVIESKLSLTGFYERYSKILSTQAATEPRLMQSVLGQSKAAVRGPRNLGLLP